MDRAGNDATQLLRLAQKKPYSLHQVFLGPVLWRKPNAMQEVHPFWNRHTGVTILRHLVNGIRWNLGWHPLSAASHVHEPSCSYSPAELTAPRPQPRVATPSENCLVKPYPSYDPQDGEQSKTVLGQTLFNQVRKFRQLQKAELFWSAGSSASFSYRGWAGLPRIPEALPSLTPVWNSKEQVTFFPCIPQ